MKRLASAIIGGTVLMIGLALAVLPSPAAVVIPIGIDILAAEFPWAEMLSEKARAFLVRKNGPKAHGKTRPVTSSSAERFPK